MLLESDHFTRLGSLKQRRLQRRKEKRERGEQSPVQAQKIGQAKSMRCLERFRPDIFRERVRKEE